MESSLRHRARPGRAGARRSLVAGFIAALLLSPAAGPAGADETDAQAGIPEGLALPIGPVQACQDGHFDPARYREALEAAGWESAGREIRADVTVRLADAFEPVTPAREDLGRGSEEEMRALRSANRAHWFSMTADRTLMVRPGAVLFLAGMSADDGHRAIECWVAMADTSVVDAIFTSALPQRDNGPDPDGIAVIEYGPVALAAGARLRVMAVRQPPATTADDELSATHGFMTRTVFPPPE
ncbi:MAG: hypothetical protein JJT95_07450 [Pararhodobacter sp.]|nr:hypothetical protein [Pararhodobacter sp.]